MTPAAILVVIAVFLWCYAAVLVVAWFRAMARENIREHVAHVVTLLGLLVPVVASVFGLLLLGGVLGVPQLVAMLVLIVPGGFVVAFQLEVSRLAPVPVQLELVRLGVAVVMAGAVLYWRSPV